MSQLRERIALLITTAENQGWHTIVAPIDFMRAAFLDSPAGMEQRLRQRALRLRATPTDGTLDSTDLVLLDEAADMIAALAAPIPEEAVQPAERLRLINLIDIIDHALLHIPSGEVLEHAHQTRIELWRALTSDPGEQPDRAGRLRLSANGADDAPVAGADDEEATSPSPTEEVEPFDARATVEAVAGVLREVLATSQAVDEPLTEEAVVSAAERIDQLYAYDLERLKRERFDSKQFESSMINQWLEAHEKSIDAERRALKARQREREAVERCAKIAEEQVDLPPDARAIRLTVHAVQRHIAAAIRNRGLSV